MKPRSRSSPGLRPLPWRRSRLRRSRTFRWYYETVVRPARPWYSPESFVAGFLHERPHSFRVLLDLTRMPGHERACHPHRITEEETLIQHLAAGECGNRGIPGKPEQRDAIKRLGARRLVIFPDVLRRRSFEIRLGWHCPQPAGADLLNDLDHPGIEPREQVPGRIQGIPGGAHDAPLIELRIGFSRAQEGLHGFQVHPDLG